MFHNEIPLRLSGHSTPTYSLFLGLNIHLESVREVIKEIERGFE